MKLKSICINLVSCIKPCINYKSYWNDRKPYSNKPIQSFSVYKFEPNPVNPKQTSVTEWKNLTSPKAHRLIPSNYKLCDEAIIKSKDYYMVIHLKSDADNICYYFIKND